MLKDEIHKKTILHLKKNNINKLESTNKTGNSGHARYQI
jgi:hypothetical protein